MTPYERITHDINVLRKRLKDIQDGCPHDLPQREVQPFKYEGYCEEEFWERHFCRYCGSTWNVQL